VIVGVSGDEIEYPLLIDYGDMSLDNVVAWDFAKLETELNVRLLAKLYCNPSTRASAWKCLEGKALQQLATKWIDRPKDQSDALVVRTQQIAFALAFERRLATKTVQLRTTPKGRVENTTHAQSRFDRAAGLINPIRTQATDYLGGSPQPCVELATGTERHDRRLRVEHGKVRRRSCPHLPAALCTRVGRQEERRDKADRKQYQAARRRKLRRQLLG
jgi:hypothetical protein